MSKLLICIVKTDGMECVYDANIPSNFHGVKYVFQRMIGKLAWAIITMVMRKGKNTRLPHDERNS